MTLIAVLTPDPSDSSFAGQWPGVLERLTSPLAAAGLTVSPRPWTKYTADCDDLLAADLVLPLLAWGYHRDHSRWLAACSTWREAGVRLLNPAPVLAWNSDKGYLRELAECGSSIPATIWLDHADQQRVDAAFDQLNTDLLIVKPRISGGAWKTLRVARGDRFEADLDVPVLIQPYLPSIETDGETSLLFFNGSLSHVVNKRPASGDFRVQVQFGGSYQALAHPPEGALELARRTLAAVGEDLLYARIDVAQTEGGGWTLMEAELIEPDFYLAACPKAGERFARAVLDRIAAQTGGAASVQLG